MPQRHLPRPPKERNARVWGVPHAKAGIGGRGIMTTKPIRFGFLNEPISVTWCYGTIKPLPNFKGIVSCFEQSAGVYNGWVYPPLRAVDGQGAADKGAWVPSSFSLPASHRLIFQPDSDSVHADFFIALFGMLNGLRLQREGWQHFYKCPTKRGKLCDFDANDCQISTTLDLATEFWLRHTDELTRKLTFGAIHWHLFAQLYEHEFERFNAQYTALDACWKLAEKTMQLTANGHAERPKVLAEALGLHTPGWALPISVQKKECSLSQRRNALVHEAMYAGEPLGFAHPVTERGMELELQNFVARCLLALLGVKNEYTRSTVNTRQTSGFDFSQNTLAP